jgi:hypothetical protein
MSESKTYIPFPCFDYRIYVVFTDDLVKSADNLVKKGQLKSPHGIDDTTGGFHVNMPNQSYSWVVLPYTADIDEITHEAYHAVCKMLNWISAKHEEEIFAYFIGYIVRMITIDQEKAKKKFDKVPNV